MNILIVKLSAIGDVVQSLPFLEAMRRTWLVEEASADLLTDHPALDRVLVSRRKTWVRELKQGHVGRTLGRIRAFLKDLRAEKYDLLVDLQGLFKSGILAFLSGGRRRVGFDRTRELSYLFLNERLAPYDPDRHALLRYLDVAACLGAEVSDAAFHLPEHGPAAEETKRLLGPAGARRVVVNTGAKWDSKLWPVAHWRELCRRLAASPGLQVFLPGAP